ncbi:MAG: hypothetical protein WBM74_16950, partial [Polyangiales bacterium]
YDSVGVGDQLRQLERLHDGAIGGARDNEDSEQDAREHLKSKHFPHLKASAALAKHSGHGVRRRACLDVSLLVQ